MKKINQNKSKKFRDYHALDAKTRKSAGPMKDKRKEINYRQEILDELSQIAFKEKGEDMCAHYERKARAEVRMLSVLSHINVGLQKFNLSEKTGVIEAEVEKELNKDDIKTLSMAYKLLMGTKGMRIVCLE